MPTELVTKVKPNINSVEVHPQQSNNNGHPVDGALVGAGSLWPNNNMMTPRYANLPPIPPMITLQKKIHMNNYYTNAHEKHYLMENGTPK